MATQTDVDRLQVAWLRLQKAVNSTLPTVTDRLWAVRGKLTGGSGGGPRPQ